MRLKQATMPWLRRAVRRLRLDQKAVSTIEFALILPVFVTLGFSGIEIAYMSAVNTQVSQMAISLADNASRLGQTDNSSVTPTVTEADIDSIMSGIMRQGESINLAENGRVIISSLEFDEATGRQFIHWQRCRGDLEQGSAYGDDGASNGLGSTTIAGAGRAGSRILAAEGEAVMVAEVYYEYDGLMSGVLDDVNMFRQEAFFLIRDDRNLGPGITGTGGQSSCD